MKKLITLSAISVFLCVLNSCTMESQPITNSGVPGIWKLVSTSGQIPNSVRTGAHMDFQETYRLFADGTFIKERDQEGIITRAEGTYMPEEEVHTLNGENIIFIIMTYDEQNRMIASCMSSQLKEELYITGDQRMVSTWQACDGPGLVYNKVKN